MAAIAEQDDLKEPVETYLTFSSTLDTDGEMLVTIKRLDRELCTFIDKGSAASLIEHLKEVFNL